MQANVVRRERVAVLTRGTLADPDMLSSQHEASYVMALTEMHVDHPPAQDRPPAGASSDQQDAAQASGEPTLGACAVDVSTGRILVGQW